MRFDSEAPRPSVENLEAKTDMLKELTARLPLPFSAKVLKPTPTNSRLACPSHKPRFHLQPPGGWVNDVSEVCKLASEEWPTSR